MRKKSETRYILTLNSKERDILYYSLLLLYYPAGELVVGAAQLSIAKLFAFSQHAALA
jgi:hypothetical protein